MRVLGLMSGTSYDAIDAAAADVELDGDELVVRPLGVVSRPYDEATRAAVHGAMPPAPTTMHDVCRIDTLVGQAFAEVAALADAELCDGAADLVVSHGQTVFHWVEDGDVRGTLQLGQPAWIAERTGCTVVADVRARDVAAGGQGAPLVSLFDVLWLNGRPGTSVALNLGGIANITAVGDSPVAFDTGPANALLDAAVAHTTDGAETFDRNGASAVRGRVHDALLERLLADPYYARPAPKTTGKELFHLPYLLEALDGEGPVEPDDLLATLVALTARTVADAVRTTGATEVVASGGGTRNPTLMAALRAALEAGGRDVTVLSSDELGVPSDGKECYAFAVLGLLAVHGLAGTVPSCTGAAHASVLGAITPGTRPLHVRPGAVAPRTLTFRA